MSSSNRSNGVAYAGQLYLLYQLMRQLNIRQRLGLAHSLLRYYGVPFRIRLLAGFYAEFIRPGDLCFDIGAHVGDRIRAWLRLGARVVALEPNPACFGILEWLYGTSEDVTLLPEAAGAAIGARRLLVSESNPTMSTLSVEWAHSIGRARQFAGVRWESESTVRTTTLDDLIDAYGRPAFCKIDVEGLEAEVLHGLNVPIKALSFEYNPAVPELADECLARLAAVGPYEFNWTARELPRLQASRWLTAREISKSLSGLSPEHPTGDVYARLLPTASQAG